MAPTQDPRTAAEKAAARKARRNADSRRWHAARRAGWLEQMELHYSAAETATIGYMLNARGRDAGIDPRSFWKGPAARIDAYASWELLRFFEDSPRITLTEWNNQTARNSDDAEYLAWLDRDEIA